MSTPSQLLPIMKELRRTREATIEIARRALETSEFGVVTQATHIAMQLDTLIDVRADEEPTGTSERSGSASTRSGGETRTRQRDGTAKPKKSSGEEQRRSGRNGKSTSPVAHPAGNEYPQFFRGRDSLLKVGWSKQNSAEYVHKATIELVYHITGILEKFRKSDSLFNAELILGGTVADDTVPYPSYQAYLVLAFLTSVGCVRKHGRDGYAVESSEKALRDIVKTEWEKLPERSGS